MLGRLFRKFSHTESRRRAHRDNVSGFESLERRQLLTPDLKINSAFMTLNDVSGDPTKYLMTVQYQVANAGNTAAELTGVPNNAGDNVTIRVWASQNKTLDANDTLLASDLILYNDTGSHLLNAGSTLISAQSLVVSPDPLYSYLILKVDPKNAVAESSESNNTIVVDAFKPQVSQYTGTLGIAAKKYSQIAYKSTACDLNSNGFYRLDVEIDDMQAHDKLKLLKSGTGADALRVVGGNVKLGTQVIGNVNVTGTGTPTLKMTFQFFADVGGVTRSVMNRVIQHLAFRAAANSTGTRPTSLTLMDNQSGLGDKVTRPMEIIG
ncbi:MAG: CARDB domain-containing protein [Planctomycetales bacterium]